MDDKDLYASLILHILHHAVETDPVNGPGMIAQLSHRGYRLSPGTPYPMLRA